jgi:hypothetical protein|tara:strand:+ start:536 stop:2365 length:1830 start_codon:yes stop_codon:yes gene_type:complete
MRNIKPDPDKYRPVAVKGLPDLPQDSLSYQEWWNEQLDRCLNGYKPHGMKKISGKYYFYLNFYWILGNSGDGKSARKTLIHPWYRDMDHEYFDLFEDCQINNHGMIVVKARDKGFSYMNSGLLAHEYTFYPHSEVGIGAGLQITANAFFDKVKKGLNSLHQNFKHSVLKDTEDMLRSGFKRKNVDGKWETGGYQSLIHCRTMDNPDVFKGERLSTMIFEEAGEFKSLLKAYMASKACFMDGDIQFGVPVIGGTGGDIEKASKDFMELYYNAEAFNLTPMFIPATKAYFGFFDIKTGVSDAEGAEKKLEEERELLRQSGKVDAYNLHIQNYPLVVEEAFLKTKNARFDISLINAQRSRILSTKELETQIEKGNLEWVIDEDGKTDRVKWVPDINGTINILLHPKPGFNNLDIGGIDSYDQDEAGASKSKGSAIIYRRFLSVDEPSDLVVAEYTDRPRTAMDFWDNCLKLAVYYNAKMLIEYTKIGILDYFKRMGAIKYLKEKPKSAHTPHTTVRNRYGVHMNKQVKALLEQVVDTYVKDSVEDIWFMELLNELADYGYRNTDRAMAFGLCLIHSLDIFERQIKQDNNKQKMGFVKYRRNKSGKLESYIYN